MRFYKKITVGLLALPLMSCSVGPDFVKLITPSPTTFTRDETLESQEGHEIESAWWEAFGSKTLNELVESALKLNPNVDAAMANIKAAQQNVVAQQGFFFPTLGANLNSSRQSVGNALSSNLSNNATMYSLHVAQLNIGFVPDIFGANRRQVESLKAQANAQKFTLDALKITIINNVVTAAVQEASLRAQIKILEASTEASRLQLEHYKRMMSTGYANDIDLAQQESLYQQALGQISTLKKAHEQTLDLLNILCGKFPSEVLELSDIESIQVPKNIPHTLPSQLVSHRPDIKIAEEMMRASNAQIGYAIANMLPQISITGLGGAAATKFGDLSKGGNAIWSIAGNASQTIFSGGTLLARKRSAEASYEASVAQYKSTVLTAFQNVADTLYALENDRVSYEIAQKNEAINLKAYQMAEEQFTKGYISEVNLLTAKQTYLQTQNATLQAYSVYLGDTAALYQALGGGWSETNNAIYVQ